MQQRTCWDRAIESAGGLEERQRAIEEFNERSRFRKRGMAMTPTKFGISFTTKFLNQVWLPRTSSCTLNPEVWLLDLLPHQELTPEIETMLILYVTAAQSTTQLFMGLLF